jgi:hypothetical protein
MLLILHRVVRIRRARESNQEAVLLAICLKTFKRSVIIFRFVFFITWQLFDLKFRGSSLGYIKH